DGVFGGKGNPTVGCILDACGFVHLVAERRDFQPATRRDLADHERGTQCTPTLTRTLSLNAVARSRISRAASIALRAAALSPPASSARNNADAPSPACLPRIPVCAPTTESIRSVSARMSSK